MNARTRVHVSVCVFPHLVLRFTYFLSSCMAALFAAVASQHESLTWSSFFFLSSSKPGKDR